MTGKLSEEKTSVLGGKTTSQHTELVSRALLLYSGMVPAENSL